MKVKHKIKKYKYLFRKKISENLSYTSRRLKSNISKTDPRKISPLEVDKLPYPVSWGEYFDYDELVVEIGTGHGELLNFLSEKSDRLSIGFEITKTYTLKTSKEVEGKSNAFAYKGDGYSLSLNLFENGSIDSIYILFPDPWHKKKHLKEYDLAGKTGTAQIPKETEVGYYEDRTNATFVGFGPVEDPKFIMLVRLEEPGLDEFAATTAAPLWVETFLKVADDLEVPKSYIEE